MATATPAQDYHRIDINHIEANQARSIGGETLALHAVIHLLLDQKLTAPGLNKIDSAAALGSIIGRMFSPGSELQTHEYSNALADCAKKTSASRKTTALRSRLTTKKTMPSVLNGSVNPKDNKKTSTAVFTA